MLIAHRGLVKEKVKENTIPAFLGAINSDKYAGFELDIYTSKDKEFIVHHSPLVNGKLISTLSKKELLKAHIVKLEDVLKLKTDKIILIDIKDININTNKLSKLLNKYQDKNIYVMSFFNIVIKKLLNNSFKVGVLNYVLNSTNYYPYDFIGLIYDLVDLKTINKFKELNIEVFLYAINKGDLLEYSNVYYIVDDKDIFIV